jgi:hypothetical protein
MIDDDHERAPRQGEMSSPSGLTHPGEYELQQAEFSCPADRSAAVLNAEFAVHGALVGLHGIERDVKPRTDLTSR